jgi:hypothetical protein
LFPYLPAQPEYNQRLRAALPLVQRMIRILAFDTDFWFDDHWLVDSAPVPSGVSLPTVQYSDLAGWAGCASPSRFFRGPAPVPDLPPTGRPILWVLTNPKIGEREVLEALLARDAALVASRKGTVLITDEGLPGKDLENQLAEQSLNLLHPARRTEKQRWGAAVLKKIHQLIESVNDTTKGQPDLEQHSGRTVEDLAIRVAQRLQAMPTAN